VSSAPTLPDPFGLTADPQGYVPRGATEQALTALLATLREGRRPVALVGPPGLGKTLLLHLAGERLDDRLRSVYLPYAALPLDELCAWALSLLGFSQSEDTIGDLTLTARHMLERGSGLLLLIDDANAMPLPTARKLGDLVAASQGALRLLLAASEGPSASRMLAATGANIHVIRLLEPMSEDETRRYVEARLARARVPASVAARFDDATLRHLHRLSAGIPRRVHSVASAVLRGSVPETGADEDEIAAPPPLPARELPATRAEEIQPALDALRAQLSTRAGARLEAPPGLGAVIAVALLAGGVAVALPGLRAALSQPASVAAAPAPVAPSTPPLPVEPEPAPASAPAPPVPVEPAATPEPPREAAAAAAEAPPVESTISVQVNARPWANIEVNGVDLGPTPIAGIPLLAGPHHFRARMPDGRVIERTVVISADDRFVVFE
jgi:type II secretory pathway predicted ATPase ExeA